MSEYVGKRCRLDRRAFNEYARSHPPHYGRLVRKMVGSDGCLYVYSVNNDRANVAEHKLGALIGTASVPLEFLKDEPGDLQKIG